MTSSQHGSHLLIGPEPFDPAEVEARARPAAAGKRATGLFDTWYTRSSCG